MKQRTREETKRERKRLLWIPEAVEWDSELRKIASTVPGSLSAAVTAAFYRADCIITERKARVHFELLASLRTAKGAQLKAAEAKFRAREYVDTGDEALLSQLYLALVYASAGDAAPDGIKARVHLAYFRDDSKRCRPALRMVRS